MHNINTEYDIVYNNILKEKRISSSSVIRTRSFQDLKNNLSRYDFYLEHIDNLSATSCRESAQYIVTSENHPLLYILTYQNDKITYINSLTKEKHIANTLPDLKKPKFYLLAKNKELLTKSISIPRLLYSTLEASALCIAAYISLYLYPFILNNQAISALYAFSILYGITLVILYFFRIKYPSPDHENYSIKHVQNPKSSSLKYSLIYSLPFVITSTSLLIYINLLSTVYLILAFSAHFLAFSVLNRKKTHAKSTETLNHIDDFLSSKSNNFLYIKSYNFSFGWFDRLIKLSKLYWQQKLTIINKRLLIETSFSCINMVTAIFIVISGLVLMRSHVMNVFELSVFTILSWALLQRMSLAFIAYCNLDEPL